MKIGAIFRFEAAHKLPFYKGECKHLHGHGYKLEVVVRGGFQNTGPETGMVMDLKELKNVVNKMVINDVDHTDLNSKFDNPTAEVMVNFFALQLMKELQHHHNGIYLCKLKLWETETAYAEWSEP